MSRSTTFPWTLPSTATNPRTLEPSHLGARIQTRLSSDFHARIEGTSAGSFAAVSTWDQHVNKMPGHLFSCLSCSAMAATSGGKAVSVSSRDLNRQKSPAEKGLPFLGSRFALANRAWNWAWGNSYKAALSRRILCKRCHAPSTTWRNSLAKVVRCHWPGYSWASSQKISSQLTASLRQVPLAAFPALPQLEGWIRFLPPPVRPETPRKCR